MTTLDCTEGVTATLDCKVGDDGDGNAGLSVISSTRVSVTAS